MNRKSLYRDLDDLKFYINDKCALIKNDEQVNKIFNKSWQSFDYDKISITDLNLKEGTLSIKANNRYYKYNFSQIKDFAESLLYLIGERE
jgi:uncharacterized protein YqkB